jgi:hypothetical protein
MKFAPPLFQVFPPGQSAGETWNKQKTKKSAATILRFFAFTDLSKITYF